MKVWLPVALVSLEEAAAISYSQVGRLNDLGTLSSPRREGVEKTMFWHSELLLCWESKCLD